MEPLGYSPRLVDPSGPGIFNSDLAFRYDLVFQGTYEGFRIIDVSAPTAPRELVEFTDCVRGTIIGNQGDVIVYGSILVRSWNWPAPEGGVECGGVFTPAGEQGVHLFDVSDPADPQGIAFVATPCGSHTATAVPDPANDRLLVYSSSSSTADGCAGFDIIEVPLSEPAAARYLGFVPAPPSCHDIGVILGDVMKAACAGGPGVRVFSIGPPGGGSLAEPLFLFGVDEPGVTIGHSAAWSWDGRVLVFGHEPGGGGQARCQSTSSDVDRSIFFYDGDTGEKLGSFLLPRPQTATENCTWHNFNVVPTTDRYVLVSGNYQAGISVVDFTDPANAREIAYADPPPLVHPTQPGTIVFGGDWASYWYDGLIFQSDTRRGLLIWRLDDPAVAGALLLGQLNPQTQEFSLP